jgi:hypothetical protein
MTDEPSKPGYEVGWGKPPKHTRFKKGGSANPKGRPRGARNLKTDLTNELGGRIRVREGDRETSISKQEAFVKSLVARALKGDGRASSLLVTMMAKLLDVASTPTPTEVGSKEQDIIEAYYRRRFAEAAIPTAGGDAAETLLHNVPRCAAKANTATETGDENAAQGLSNRADAQEP